MPHEKYTELYVETISATKNLKYLEPPVYQIFSLKNERLIEFFLYFMDTLYTYRTENNYLKM